MTPDAFALRAIGWPHAGAVPAGDWSDAMAAHPQAAVARVIEQHRSGYIVATGPAPDAGVPVESPQAWQRPSGYRRGTAQAVDRAAVGDWVLVEDGLIVALLPRRTTIKRAAAGEHYQQQLIAANVDTVLVVCGLDGDFNPRRIERYLLLVHDGGTRAVVVLTKADRDGADVTAALAALTEVAGQGIPALAVDARDPASVAALLPWLQAGMTAVLVGSSGAGKSTLTNTLLGEQRMKTSAVRETDDRGRHTTTHRALIPLPSGACLIDTPGMRELKPTGEEDLADGGFADIAALAESCRFRDCVHDNEPGCAVRAALADGRLESRRFANYLKLRDEVAGAAERLAARLAQLQGQKPGRPSSRAPGRRPGRPGAR